jgi:hypothetical protein
MYGISSIFEGHVTSTGPSEATDSTGNVADPLDISGFRPFGALPANFGYSSLFAEPNTHTMLRFGKGTDCTSDRNIGNCHCLFFGARLLSCLNCNSRVQNISTENQHLSVHNTF